jgi:hypothetical protein
MARINTVEKYRGPRDPSKALPRCGRAGCGRTIQKGDRYFWWANRAPGMRGGQKHFRCNDHFPTLAERTPGRRGQLYGIQEAAEQELALISVSQDGEGVVEVPEPDAFTSVAESAADELEALAEEIREGAQNIEDGFGHETEQSAEMVEKADALDEVVQDLRSIDIDEAPEQEEDEDADAFEARVDEWAEEQRDKVNEKLQEAEV